MHVIKTYADKNGFQMSSALVDRRVNGETAHLLVFQHNKFSRLKMVVFSTTKNQKGVFFMNDGSITTKVKKTTNNEE